MEGASFVRIGIDTYSGYGFASPAYNDFAKTTTCGLTECLIHHPSSPHSIVSDQGTHFTTKECAHAHGTHCFCHVVCHPEAAGLIGW